MSDGGKGSSPRPIEVPIDQYNKNWEQTFGKKQKINEDVPTNSTGPVIAGIGVGPQGEPGINKKKKKMLIPFKMFKRQE